MTNEEKQIVSKFIEAQNLVNTLTNSLQFAKRDLQTAANELTEAWWKEDENNTSIATIPTTFTIKHKEQLYMIEIDMDGNSRHSIIMVDEAIE